MSAFVWLDDKWDDPDWSGIGIDSFIAKIDGEWWHFANHEEFEEHCPNCEINENGEVVKKTKYSSPFLSENDKRRNL